MKEGQENSIVTRSPEPTGDELISCGNCCYSKSKGNDMHCRRYPPTVYFNSDMAIAETKYPGVASDYSCGEGKT